MKTLCHVLSCSRAVQFCGRRRRGRPSTTTFGHLASVTLGRHPGTGLVGGCPDRGETPPDQGVAHRPRLPRQRALCSLGRHGCKAPVFFRQSAVVVHGRQRPGENAGCRVLHASLATTCHTCHHSLLAQSTSRVHWERTLGSCATCPRTSLMCLFPVLTVLCPFSVVNPSRECGDGLSPGVLPGHHRPGRVSGTPRPSSHTYSIYV